MKNSVIFLAIVIAVALSSCQSYRYVSQEARANEIRNQITVCQKNIERYSKAHNHGDSSAVQMIELYRHQLVQYEQTLTTILSSDEERVSISTNDPYGGSVFIATAKGDNSSASNTPTNQSGECLLLVQNKFRSISDFYDNRNTVYFTVYRVSGLTNKQERLEKWSLSDINWRKSVAIISNVPLRPEENQVLELTPGNYVVEFKRGGKSYYSNAVLNPAKTMHVSHEDLTGTGYNINQINNLAAIIPK